jgi:hypothetical protein
VSEDDALSENLDEVLRLVTALAEQLLTSEIPAGSISPERLRALIGAVQFLDDNDVPWPASVQEALDKVRQRMDAKRLASDHGDAEV